MAQKELSSALVALRILSFHVEASDNYVLA